MHEDITDNQRNDNDNDDALDRIADSISKEALVRLLVKKGVCSINELYEEEQKLKDSISENEPLPLVQIPSFKETGLRVHHHKKMSWLKRKMVKRHWTRRLGTALFGWEWKKVRVKTKEPIN